MTLTALMFVSGFILGAAAFYLLSRRERSLFEESRSEKKRIEEALRVISADKARLETVLEKERESFSEKEALLDSSKEALTQAFKALAADALHQNSRDFLDKAGSVVTPLKESLQKMDGEIKELEGKRIEAYTGLLGHIANVQKGQEKLDATTDGLLRALRSPKARGNWGEMQLKRVVEISGMTPFVDFREQVQITAERDTPDMVINLPGGRKVMVDAKASMDAFLKAMDAETEEEKKALLLEHGANVRARLRELSKKEYWDKMTESPEFVVMFLPGESYFAAVLEQDIQFLDDSVRAKVIPASPLTLIALLKAVAYGWKQEEVAKDAENIIRNAKELYERLCKSADHIGKLGKSIHGSVETYNDFVGSIERMVLSKGREIARTSDKQLPELQQVHEVPRSLQSPDWKSGGEE